MKFECGMKYNMDLRIGKKIAGGQLSDGKKMIIISPRFNNL